jgi:NAD(P)H-dependent FMN reductase
MEVVISRPLSIPVILGTVRKGRMSGHVARLFVDLLNQHDGVRSTLIDIAQLALVSDDAGESIKVEGFSAAMSAADGIVIVSPEYNHSFPGLLKHALDSCLKEYVHKAVGLIGVSSGPFAGTRVVQSLLPVMRELGLVTVFWDVNIGQVEKLFDHDGRLLDDAVIRRADRFVRELLWMAKVLRQGRESVTIGDEASATTSAPPPIECPGCGAAMNHHADKQVTEAMTELLQAIHLCAVCGMEAATPALSPTGELVGADGTEPAAAGILT